MEQRQAPEGAESNPIHDDTESMGDSATPNTPTVNTATPNTATPNTPTFNMASPNTATPNTATVNTASRNTQNPPEPHIHEDDTLVKRTINLERSAQGCPPQVSLTLDVPPPSPGPSQTPGSATDSALAVNDGTSPPQSQLMDHLPSYASPINLHCQQGTVPGSGRAMAAPLGGSSNHRVRPPADTMLVRDINMECLTKLTICLVPHGTIIYNWKHIASKHGVTNAKIEFLDYCSRQDLLVEMLRLPEFVTYTVGEFKKDLLYFKRLDALDIISK